MSVTRALLAITVSIITAAQAYAADIAQLSLGEAIARGLKYNNQGRAARFQAEAARSGATAASLHYLPSVTLEESWTRSNVPVNTFMMKLNQGRFTAQDFDPARLNNPSPVSDYRSAVTIEQPLLVPSAWAGQRVAERGAERQEALARLSREQVAFEVFQRYLAVQTAKAQLQVAEKAVDETRESRRQAIIRTKAGLGLKSDELRAETQLASVEQQSISAANNLVLARMQLALATGGQPDEQLDVRDGISIRPPDQQPATLLELANRQRLDLRAAQRAKEQADAALLQTRTGYLPTVGAFGSWQMDDHANPVGRDHDAWMVGATLRWNIFDGFRTWNTSAQAGASRAAAEEMLEQTRKEVNYEVRESVLRRQEAEKRLQVAQAAVVAAEETTRILSKRFDNALATMLELLDAQNALNQARANLVESNAALLLATGRVYYAAGTFLKEVQQ